MKNRQFEHIVWFHPKNFWMESPCMFNLSILHVWLNIFGLDHPVCSICPYFMCGDMKYWQLEHTGWFHPKVLNQTWSTDKLNIQGGSIQVLNQTWSSQYFMPSSKLLYWIILYVQLVSTSYLVHNFWMESPCMFNLFVLHVWIKTFRWNLPLCSMCKYFLSGKSDMKDWQVEPTGWFHPSTSFETDMKNW
jgi:hypothetical protein